jgi:hypothetical protein
VVDLGDGSVVGADGKSVVVHVQDQVLALIVSIRQAHDRSVVCSIAGEEEEEERCGMGMV